jgi:hypothetical protein
MTSAMHGSTRSWIAGVVSFAENLAAAVDNVDALCNAVPDDSGGAWACDLALASIQMRAALAAVLVVLQDLNQQAVVYKIEHEQGLTELH